MEKKGRPVQAYDNTGIKVWETDYDIYGRLRNLQGEKQFIPFRQLGQYEDEELDGLYYNRFRYYDCNIGGYISQDPIGLEGNNPNFYAYVWDSNSWIDFFGLSDGNLNGMPKGSVRRPKSPGDLNFPTSRAARRAAMRSQNIPTSQSYQTKISRLPKGDQNNLDRLLYKEEIYTGGKKTGGVKKIGEVNLHSEGHLFTDVKPNPHYEPPHYHGKGGEHYTYDKGSPRSTNPSMEGHDDYKYRYCKG